MEVFGLFPVYANDRGLGNAVFQIIGKRLADRLALELQILGPTGIDYPMRDAPTSDRHAALEGFQPTAFGKLSDFTMLRE